MQHRQAAHGTVRGMVCGAGMVGQQGLLPRPSDPRLWLLEVRPGLERTLIVSLMNRAISEPLLIKSAFTHDHLPVSPSSALYFNYCMSGL